MLGRGEAPFPKAARSHSVLLIPRICIEIDASAPDLVREHSQTLAGHLFAAELVAAHLTPAIACRLEP